MIRIAFPGLKLVRRLGLAAAALLALSVASGQPAAAMSPINPGVTPSATYTSDGLLTQVRGGHGGGGGFGHGGFGHGGGFRGGGWRGGWRGGPYFGGGFYPYFYDDDYPDYYYYPDEGYPVRRCRIVKTKHGRHRVCHWSRMY